MTEAELLEMLHVEWYARIFDGSNPRYAVLDWNRDPQGLNRYIVEKYYVEECGASAECYADISATEGILDCVSATSRFAIQELASGDRPLDEDEVRRIHDEIIADVIYHTPFMLGIPGKIKFQNCEDQVLMETLRSLLRG